MTIATTVTSMVDSTLVAKEKTIKPSLFSVDSSSTGGAYPNAVFLRSYWQRFPRWWYPHRATRQMSLSAEVRMRAKYNVKERRRLEFVVEEKDELLKARDEKIENLKA
nr:hypothetical protein [Tanacetum cinerariifolium]